MFSVALLRRGPESETQKTGIGRYADAAKRGIIAGGADCENIYYVFEKHIGFLKGIRKGFIDPLMDLINSNGKNDIYHAADELCGLYLPLLRGKRVVTFHHITRPGEDISGIFGRILWKISAAISVRYADKILAVSPQTRDEIVEMYGLDPNDIEVLPFEIGRQFRILEDVKRSMTVGYAGSLIPRKNVASLIRSFKKVTGMPGTADARLVICGEGPERDELTELVKELNIAENVEFISGLTDEEIVRLYNSVSAYVQPAKHEGLSLTIIEAQRCRAPVLYFEDARIPDEVKKYAVPCSGEDGLAEQMHRCLTDERYRNAVADAAFGHANDFGEDFGERIVEIYKDLLSR